MGGRGVVGRKGSRERRGEGEERGGRGVVGRKGSR